MPYIVALTGGIASGKTTIANLFAQRGIDIIDADLIAREVVAPGTPALKALSKRFGPSVLLSDGSLERQQLRKRIFLNTQDRLWLNQLLHPLIQQRTQQLIQQATSVWCLWVVPLLYENNLQHRANRVLVTDIDEQTQIERTLKRDAVSQEQVKAIIQSQATRQQRLSIADDIIDNRLPYDQLYAQIIHLDNVYRKASLAHHKG